MKTKLLLLLLISFYSSSSQPKQITKNGMKISWSYKEDRVFVEMNAPINGWVAIGFNDSEDIMGTYLIMANVINGDANVVEHYVLSPGNYKPITSFGAKPQIQNIEGNEDRHKTRIKFSLSIMGLSKYQKHLTKGKEIVMHIAYSQEDDFQHHSIMRTSVKVKL